MSCKCVWCDCPASGIVVNVSGELMHEDCYDDYQRELCEVIAWEKDDKSYRESVCGKVSES